MPAEEALEAGKVLLAERMHWTLDYIDGLDDRQYHHVVAILEAKDKAQNIIASRKAPVR